MNPGEQWAWWSLPDWRWYVRIDQHEGRETWSVFDAWSRPAVAFAFDVVTGNPKVDLLEGWDI